MFLIRKPILIEGMVCAAATLGLPKAHAEMLTFGIYGANNSNAGNVVRDVLGVDNTSPFVVGMPTLNDLCGIDVLWVLNSRKQYEDNLLANVGVIEAFVDRGGTLIFHDRAVERYVTASSSYPGILDPSGILPGASGVTFVKDLSLDTNVGSNTTMVTNGSGPGGVILDGTLDVPVAPYLAPQGYSNHGYADLSTLPGGATAILTRPDPTQVVDFTYDYGDGHVYYSTVPLDYYLGGAGDPFEDIYAPNVIAYANSIGQQVECNPLLPPMTPVPEPSSATIFGISALVAGICARRRKRNQGA